MIVFDLRCARAHVFEAWFGSGAAYEEQRTRGLLSCPICGDAAIVKAAMAPNVSAKGNARAVPQAVADAVPSAAPSPAHVKAALLTLARAQAEVLAKSEWVGRGFADRARAMHDGGEPPAPIHGEATRAEARALVEDGIGIAPLPLPVVPPDAVN